MKFYTGIGSIALLVSILHWSCSEKQAQTAGRQTIPVSIATAMQKDVPVQIRVIGTVEPYSTVSAKSQVSGELKAVSFKEGQDVKRGELLFTIDTRPFESDIKRTEANLAKNMALAKQVEANLARDLAQTRQAEVEARRYQRLADGGMVSKEEYERIRTNWEVDEAAVRADRAALENANEAARADRAAIENAKLQLEYCSIRSPIDGRTGSLLIYQGNLVKANDTTLVVINQICPIYVTFSVPEQELIPVKRYMAAGSLKVEAAIPKQENTPARGVLTFVDNKVDNTTGTIRLKGTFANDDKRLWPGQFVHVTMTLTSRPNSLVIPSQAIQNGQSGPFVFVVRSDLTVESRPVVPGKTLEGETVVDLGLQPGERVVIDGQLRLVPGAAVEVKGAP